MPKALSVTVGDLKNWITDTFLEEMRVRRILAQISKLQTYQSGHSEMSIFIDRPGARQYNRFSLLA